MNISQTYIKKAGLKTCFFDFFKKIKNSFHLRAITQFEKKNHPNKSLLKYLSPLSQQIKTIRPESSSLANLIAAAA